MENFFLVSYLVFLNIETISDILKNWNIYHVFSKIGKYISYFRKMEKMAFPKKRAKYDSGRVILVKMLVLSHSVCRGLAESEDDYIKPQCFGVLHDIVFRLLHGDHAFFILQVMVLADMMQVEVKVVVTKEAGQARYMIDLEVKLQLIIKKNLILKNTTDLRNNICITLQWSCQFYCEV